MASRGPEVPAIGVAKPVRPAAASPTEAAPEVSAAPLLEIRHFSLTLHGEGPAAELVSDISLTVHANRTLAVVGESGSGKSVTALSVLRLLPDPPLRVTDGALLLHDPPGGAPVDILTLGQRELCGIRGRRIAMVFQEPMTAFHPLKTIGDQLVESLELHMGLHGRAARRRAAEWLARVGMDQPLQRLRQYPHELSGGLRQRAMIAMALCAEPCVLIADEPTTALDVTLQARILSLLRDLQRQTRMGMMLITHDLGVVAQIADDVAVMYAGRIIEAAPVQELFAAPRHPYTRALLDCLPRMTPSAEGSAEGTVRRLTTIPGRVPDASQYPPGCRFAPRCVLTREWAQVAVAADVAEVKDHDGRPVRVLRRCVRGVPGVAESPPLDPVAPNHFVACWEVARTR